MLLLPVIFTVMALYGAADARQCRSCMFFTVSCPSNPFMEMILQSVFESLNDEHCVGNPEMSELVDCEDNDMVCGSVNTEIDMLVDSGMGNIAVTMGMLTHQCMESEDHDIGCHDIKDIEDEIIAEAQVGSDAEITDISGQYCLCGDEVCYPQSTH